MLRRIEIRSVNLINQIQAIVEDEGWIGAGPDTGENDDLVSAAGLLALVLLLLPAPALADVKEKVAALAPSGLVLVVDGKGNELVTQNADEPFVPASVTKIVTAWLALEVLGGDYRFETRFYLDDNRLLYIHGGGDPFLISEELALLATNLVAAIGKKPITGIVLDASYFPSNLCVPGIEDTGEAYNALNSALAVNFNTIYAVRNGNKVTSAEKQTPITPLAIAQFRARGSNGNGRISLMQDSPVSLQYAGELIAAFIERAGAQTRSTLCPQQQHRCDRHSWRRYWKELILHRCPR
jgi:D-alanyl-D-alanine carboxypeptidase/D-alanyl-D-alanine-endopeptidase (penicillin-binding protein 4)